MSDWKLKKAEDSFKDLTEEQKESFTDRVIDRMADAVSIKRLNYELELMSDFTEDARELQKNFGKMQGISSGYPKIFLSN